MIVSASRRTDLPGCYPDWLMARFREGCCRVPNPFNPRQIATISLAPDDLDAVVFWSKNPRPLLSHLDELETRGLRFYFQYTLNPYGPRLEPGLPALDERVDTFLALARRLGPRRIVWRYDPIVVSTETPCAFHERQFAELVARLRGATRRVVVSVLDFYRKTERRLARLETDRLHFARDVLGSPDLVTLLRSMRGAAEAAGMEIQSCAEDLSAAGIPPGRCVDAQLINQLWGLDLGHRKDAGQRPGCACSASRDIGMPDTCVHGCAYCYATASDAVAARRHRLHDPAGDMLIGPRLT